MKTNKLGMMRATTALVACLTVPLALGGCGLFSKPADDAEQEKTEQTEQTESKEDKDESEAGTSTSKKDSKKSEEDDRLDLLVLVNKENALPDGWEDKLELEGETNIKGEYVEVDKIAYDAFKELQEDLEKNEGITIELNSGYRSIERQQEIWDEFMVDYGEEYVLEYVAEPGHSEHHTGLALDALLVEDGEPIVTNEDIFARQDTWDVIHSYLAKHGFILRYLDGEEDITGYTYEPWHIRYVGVDAAQEIMKKGITLEEYLGEA